jgi:hypothetical protein
MTAAIDALEAMSIAAARSILFISPSPFPFSAPARKSSMERSSTTAL